MKNRFADIALPVPIDHTFTYIIPPQFAASAQRGVRVLVPFGKKLLTGLILSTTDSTTVKNLRPIIDVLDHKPALSEKMIDLVEWISQYYFAPIGEVIKSALAPGLLLETKQSIRLMNEDLSEILPTLEKKAPQQYRILSALSSTRKTLTVQQIKKQLGIQHIYSILHPLIDQGLIDVEPLLQRPKAQKKMVKMLRLTSIAFQNDDANLSGESIGLTSKQADCLNELRRLIPKEEMTIPLTEFLRESKFSSSVIGSLEKKGFVRTESTELFRSPLDDQYEPPKIHSLTKHQQEAIDQVSAAIELERYQTFLLHGVTASGKTQVYIEAIRKIRERGKTAIVLVPEIALTPQTVRRFSSHFESDVVVMHSQMSAGERYDAWRMAQSGQASIVIGPRSAIFAPLDNLGLVVVDEEHEASYKQFDASPRYNARDVAIVRARISDAIVILGSATPSAESYHNAITQKYTLLELPERIDDARLPKVIVVDMIQERKCEFEELKKKVKEEKIPFPKKLPIRSVSKKLKTEIDLRIARGEGTILLQNRRGYSHFVECFDCGYVEKCSNCEVTLTYHSTKKHLRCHYCGISKKPPSVCPVCKGNEIRFYSLGTQQVEEELKQTFSKATIQRMDLDTTSKKGSHDKILTQFERGECDILLGTQMVAKGLDFPRVTLVGVISADTQMFLPDFRSSERTFQLLTQVAGRAGRSTLEGEVVIQTQQPDHYSLGHVLAHDYVGFMKKELQYREELNYPPYSRIILIEIKGTNESELLARAESFKHQLMKAIEGTPVVVLGPADAAIPKIRSYFRKHIVIKNPRSFDPSGKKLRSIIVEIAKSFCEQGSKGKSKSLLTIDVDPQGMM